MTTVRRTIPFPREQVFAALVTPETYPHWLVGAQAIRMVDDGWPAVGTAFHHRVGVAGPLTVADLSKVLAIEEPTLLSLEVRARPFGRGRATFRLAERTEGGAVATEVVLDEVPIGAAAPAAPLLDPFTRRRNDSSLENLERYLGSVEALADRS